MYDTRVPVYPGNRVYPAHFATRVPEGYYPGNFGYQIYIINPIFTVKKTIFKAIFVNFDNFLLLIESISRKLKYKELKDDIFYILPYEKSTRVLV